MNERRRSGLEEFQDLLEAYRQTLTWAVGGSAILPLIASFAGLAPIWPPAIALLSSLFTLLAIIICFQFFRRRRKRVIDRFMLLSLSLLIVFLILYLILISVFLFQVPTTGEKIYLGCGWSELTREIASEFLVDPATWGCPGQYETVLESQNYESQIVWDRASVTFVRIAAVVLWLTVFTCLATFIGACLVFQIRR